MREVDTDAAVEDVNVHRAQNVLNYVAGYSELVNSPAGRRLRELRAAHFELSGTERPSALEVYDVVVDIFDRYGERPRFEAGRRKRQSRASRWPTLEDHELRKRGARGMRQIQRDQLRKLCARAGIDADPHIAELELAWSIEVGLPEEPAKRLLSEAMRWGWLERVAPERLADELDRYAGAAVALGAVEPVTD